MSDLYYAEEVYKSMALLALDISFELMAMDGGVTYESGAAAFAATQQELTALARGNASLRTELQTVQGQVARLASVEARLTRFESTLSRLEALGLVPDGSNETQVAEMR
jgi:hypothetical protein